MPRPVLWLHVALKHRCHRPKRHEHLPVALHVPRLPQPGASGRSDGRMGSGRELPNGVAPGRSFTWHESMYHHMGTTFLLHRSVGQANQCRFIWRTGSHSRNEVGTSASLVVTSATLLGTSASLLVTSALLVVTKKLLHPVFVTHHNWVGATGTASLRSTSSLLSRARFSKKRAGRPIAVTWTWKKTSSACSDALIPTSSVLAPNSDALVPTS